MKKVALCLVTLLMSSLVLVGSVFGQTTQFRGAMISPRVTAADLQVLGQAWNGNMVRWQLNWEGNKANTGTVEAYDAWLETALIRLDGLLPVCEKYGLKVIVDLHSTPGGNDSAGYTRILLNAQWQQHFVDVWKKIAARYAGNQTVWGYDLANEPACSAVPAGLLDWNQLATLAGQTIRSIDPVHTIVVEPLLWGKANGFPSLRPLPGSIANVVYSFHMYYPNEFTHQLVGSPYNKKFKYPGVVNKTMWDKAQLRRSMQPAIDFQRTYGVRLLVGEFSAVRWAPAGSAYNYLKDVIDIFEENGWDWTYHAFREFDGWSVEHTEDMNDKAAAKAQTSRERLLRKWFQKNVR